MVLMQAQKSWKFPFYGLCKFLIKGGISVITQTFLDLVKQTGSGFSNKSHMNKPCVFY